ncbi:MAG: hypothetical protein N4A74_02440 [Carboxylicivirga sp.]|nr:hypothetical protein [Carboxylicivirga sp.]
MIKYIKQLMFFIHRWTGLLMSLFFVVWFVSGIVMIYHSFPKPQPQKYYHGLNVISGYDSLPTPTALFKQSGDVLFSLEMLNGEPIYRMPGRLGKVYNAKTLKEVSELKKEECESIVKSVFSAPINRYKVINDFDQWIPWSYYEAYFPIYKFWLDDAKGTQLYVSASKGCIVQETTSLSRTMAWFGAIPHWMYFKALRLKVQLWSSVVIWISAIGCIACLSGLIVGLVRLRKGKISPYRKATLRWHHISGLTFGLIVFSFILSGLMSLADVPTWLVSKEKDFDYNSVWNSSDRTITKEATLNLYEILSQKANNKRIICRNAMGRIFYEVYTKSPNQSECYIVDEQVKPLPAIESTFIENWMAEALPHKQYSIHFVQDYTNYYQPSKRYDLPLPVCCLNLKDEFQTKLFVCPKTGRLLKVVNNSSRLGWWLYKGLHTFKFSFMSGYEGWRQLWMILISIGGTIVSITSFILGIKMIRKKISK